MKTLLAFLSITFLLSCNPTIEKKVETQNTSEAIDPGYDPESKLSELGIELQMPGTPVANYVHAVKTGNLLFLAGKGPKKPDGDNIVGKLGEDVTIEQGYEAARLAGISQLAVLKSELGNLNKVKRIVKVKGMVNAPT